MRFNPEWHELFELLGGAAHLVDFMPAKLKDNAAVDTMLDLIESEVELHCGTEDAGVNLIEVVDSIMCLAYVAGYKAHQADVESGKEFEERCRSEKRL